MANNKRIFVASDFHIGASYSNFQQALATFEAKLGAMNADASGDEQICVLNGDIFDFYDTTLSGEKSLELAEKFLEALITRYPNVKFEYLMGNHDNINEFGEVLNRLQQKAESGHIKAAFELHPSLLQIGDTVFLHGDLPIKSRGGVLADSVLPGGTIFRSNGGYADMDNLPYTKQDLMLKDQLKRTIITQIVGRWIFPLKQSIEDIGNAFATLRTPKEGEDSYFEHNGIKHVCFGHIHLPSRVGPQEYDGIGFHVTGSATSWVPHNVLDIEMVDGKALPPRHLHINELRKELPSDWVKPEPSPLAAILDEFYAEKRGLVGGFAQAVVSTFRR